MAGQQSEYPRREAPGGSAQAAAISDDNKASVAAREALQQEARSSIAAGRRPGEIGSAP